MIDGSGPFQACIVTESQGAHGTAENTFVMIEVEKKQTFPQIPYIENLILLGGG